MGVLKCGGRVLIQNLIRKTKIFSKSSKYFERKMPKNICMFKVLELSTKENQELKLSQVSK